MDDEPGENGVVPLRSLLPEDKTGKNGGYRHGKNNGAEQGKRDSPGHRPEKPAFDLLERENRQVRCDDDRDCVKHRPLHFMCGGSDSISDGLVDMVLMAEVPDDVF